MQFPRYFVYIACIASCVVSIAVGALTYFTLKPHPNVLGASTSVTVLDKKYFEQIPTSKFKYYYEMKPNATVLGTAHWLTDRVAYTINDDGIHSEKNFKIPKPQNTYRIMVLGDSFAFGQFVNTKENFSSRLSEMLDTSDCGKKKNFEVINLGIQGYDIGYTIEHFRRLGVKYQPDLVIWLVNTHNIVPLDERSDRFTSIIAQLSEEQKETLKNGNDYMPFFAQAAEDVLHTIGTDEIALQLEKNLRSFNEVYSGPLFVMINDTMNHAEYKRYIRTDFEHRPFTYISDAFPNLASVHGEHTDKHPNRIGHIAIAAHIYKSLTEKQLIDCEAK